MPLHARPRPPLWERLATAVSAALAVGMLVGFVILLLTGSLDTRWVRPSNLPPADPARPAYGTTP